jgi:hypothetical protein
MPFSSSNSSALVTLRADLPPFPFDNLGADATCSNCEWVLLCYPTWCLTWAWLRIIVAFCASA